MADTDKQLNAARAAKKKARKVFAKHGCVGVGLTRRKGRYAVKILLAAPLAAAIAAPDVIDGVPVVTQVVGKVKKQAAARPAGKTVRRAKATR